MTTDVLQFRLFSKRFYRCVLVNTSLAFANSPVDDTKIWSAGTVNANVNSYQIQGEFRRDR